MNAGAGGWPSLGLDARDLRSLLDQLRAAMERPAAWRPSGGSLSLHIDRDGALDGLRSLLAVLDGVDLDARRFLPQFGVSSGHSPEAGRLRDLLSNLSMSLRERVESRLGPVQVALLRRLLVNAAPDYLGLLERTDDENENSKVLRWLLDPRTAPNVSASSLYALVGNLDDADRWREAIGLAMRVGSMSVRREFVFGREWSADSSRDRIDLVISGPGFVLAIENKLWSPEHDGQTACYWAWLETLREPLRGGIFLTPTGIPPACPAFKAVSYLDLLACLLSARERTPTEEIVLSGYLHTLATRILRVEIAAVAREGGV